MKRILLTSDIRAEQDVVFVRQRARDLAALLKCDRQEQTRIATSVSEVARNAYQYAGGGRVEFAVEDFRKSDRVEFVIAISDKGPGIPHLEEILEGRYRSPSGMGLGLLGAKRLMDGFDVASAPGQGTTVTLRKRLPLKVSAATPELFRGVIEDLMQSFQREPFDELRVQNQELLNALETLQRKQDELNQMNQELEDTNRGVVALYAELDEKAEALRRANSVKTRFLSNMTHEFRTPLNAMKTLTRLLLDRVDGPLTEGQEKQIQLIRSSVEGLSELVNDLLDIAKVEAGKIPVRVTEFELAEVFASIRGLFRSHHSETVELMIEEPLGIPNLRMDEGKVAQIVRNLVSNALKYTERGQVRVRARMQDDRIVAISVSDTGIGIAPEHQERIFEEFVQIESSLQQRNKGTGLGLALSRRLIDILGGTLTLESAPGEGSTFTFFLPLLYHGPEEADYITEDRGGVHPTPEKRVSISPPLTTPVFPRILLIDDQEADRYLLRSILTSNFECSVLEATSGSEGLRIAERERPSLIFVDLVMPDLSGFEVFRRLRDSSSLQGIPVVVFSGKLLNSQERQWLDGVVTVLSKTEPSEETLIVQVIEAARSVGLQIRVRL